ncbi:hypothetical protein FQN54_004411 [Arachnomyces sp. PD_36]|nr:hypothetical protein FQN54_004411 [Arachnomyces sp. PD_36]
MQELSALLQEQSVLVPEANTSLMLLHHKLVFLAASLLMLSRVAIALDDHFQVISPEFNSVLGSHPTLTLLYTAKKPLFHEGAIYDPPTKSLFVSSNQIDTKAPSPVTNDKLIIISRVSGLYSPSSVKIEQILAPEIPLPNGGVRYLPSPDGSNNKLLWCAQGTLNASPPNGIVAMTPTPPYNTTNILSSYYGIPFNSPNDVVVAQDGSIWFTDPIYGFVQGVRPAPKLPGQVYRFDPSTNSTRAIADGFWRPNGLAFDVNEKVLYVTDTGQAVGEGTKNFQRPASIYAFDVQKGANGQIFVANRRLFAYATNGIPDGVKVDYRGNVYSGVGDGVAVWNSRGDLIGKILIDGGCANFGFGEPGVLFLLNEERLFRADISTAVKGVAS